MAAKLFVCLVFTVSVMVGVSGFFVERHRNIIPGEETMDVSDFSIYYDMKTNQTIKKMMPRPWYKPGWLLRLPFTGGPCMCEGLQCTCCTGIRIQTLNFDRQACTKLSYEPAESLLNMEVTMNGDNIYRNSFSARNPPPFCVPIVVPYLPPGLVDMCIRFFDIAVMDQRLHVCMDWDTRIDKAPVLILHFDCMDMGLDGVGLSKPSGSDQNTAITEMPTSSPEDAQIDSDVFDPVVEPVPVTVYPFNNTRKYI